MYIDFKYINGIYFKNSENYNLIYENLDHVFFFTINFLNNTNHLCLSCIENLV